MLIVGLYDSSKNIDKNISERKFLVRDIYLNISDIVNLSEKAIDEILNINNLNLDKLNEHDIAKYIIDNKKTYKDYLIYSYSYFILKYKLKEEAVNLKNKYKEINPTNFSEKILENDYINLLFYNYGTAIKTYSPVISFSPYSFFEFIKL